MKQSHLKALVKEIITQVMSEMPQQPQARTFDDVRDWRLVGDGIVSFNGVRLTDGRQLNILVEFSGGDDGSVADKVEVIGATGVNGTQLPVDPAVVAAGNALFDSYEEDILAKEASSNEPGAIRDRQMGL